MSKKVMKVGNGHHKDFEYNLETEHGRRLAEESKERTDAKEQYKETHKEYTMEISRDDIDRLQSVIKKHPNAGKFKDLVSVYVG